MDPSIISAAITGLASIVSTIISAKKPNESDVSISSAQLIELQNKILAIQSEAFKYIEDNHDLSMQIKKLQKQLDKLDEVERHQEHYITLKNDPLKIKYCATCYGKDGSLIQLNDYTEDRGCAYCTVCKDDYVTDRALYNSVYSRAVY